MNKLSTDPKLCLSAQDSDIQRKCEMLLNSTPTFKDIKYSIGFKNFILNLF